MEAKFISFKVDRYQALSIYDYNEFVRKLIYQFKGCYDYELYDVFLDGFYSALKIRYSGYQIIPIPSYQDEDEERGFNHVVEIFNKMGLNMQNILVKTEKHKQATSSFSSRQEVYKFLELKEKPDLTGKAVLLVDDVYTTGATMKAAITLIEKLNPKVIKVLVVAKTAIKPEEITNTN